MKKAVLKKVMVVLLTLVLLSSLFAQATAAQSPEIYINGKLLVTDSPAFIESGRTLLPLRGIFEALSQDVQWNPQDQTVTSGDIWLQINNPTARIGTREVKLDVAAKIVDSRTYVPLRFIAESLDRNVGWDGVNNRVDITDSDTTYKEKPAPDTDKTEYTNSDLVALRMSDFFSDLLYVDEYYSDGLEAVAMVKPDVGTGDNVALSGSFGLRFYNMTAFSRFMPTLAAYSSTDHVPREFLEPLPPGGGMDAPPGACGPTAAKPKVEFKTAGGATVTPELLADKNIRTLPTGMTTMDSNNPGSLHSTINSMVDMGDQSLATPEGWNTQLWDRLKDLQVPAESLMDYQLWNASGDIEKMIVDSYLQTLQSAGAPPIVIEAFLNSNTSGWYANSKPAAQDALAKMEIEAEMTGSINGTVYEQRDFSIPGAGTKPVYGVQTGDGTVTWDHPEYGLLTFEVDILLDQFDEQGRAIGGNTVGVDTEQGYEVHFTFLPDGSKDGKMLKDGELIGLLTMATDAERFENYVDVETQQSEPLSSIRNRYGEGTMRVLPD